MKLIVATVVLCALTAMALHTALSWVPRNVQEIEGITLGDEAKVIDLKERLQQSLDKSYEVAITEHELNQYIASKLQLTHSPIIDDYIKIKGVYVDVKDDLLDITIEREFDYPQNTQSDGSKKISFLPFSQTVSMQIEVVTDKGEDGSATKRLHFPGATFGKAPAPGMFVYLVRPSFEKVAEFFADELDIAYHDMTSITVKDGVIHLDPRPLVRVQTPAP